MRRGTPSTRPLPRRSAHTARRPARRDLSTRRYRTGAQSSLRRFRQASVLAVALTAFLLLLTGSPEPTAAAPPTVPGLVAVQDTGGADAPSADPAAGADANAAQGSGAVRPGLSPGGAFEPDSDSAAANPAKSVQEAGRTIHDLVQGWLALLPKLGIAVGLLVFAWLASRLARPAARRIFGRWERAEGAAAVAGIVIWLTAIVAGVSVVVGDARAVAGSVGLLGLAASWALQAPIESFTGWLLNSFRMYYRVGDRVAVGEVFGDVYRVDLLTTTVWEAGGPDKAVAGAQPTGALVTFPNSEVFRSNVINYTRDFPAVWDEVSVSITNESDLDRAVELTRATSRDVLGEWMETAAADYRVLLKNAGLPYDVSGVPEVYLTPGDSWTNVTVRYLVPARERRGTASRLYQALSRAISAGGEETVQGAYPRQRVDVETRG